MKRGIGISINLILWGIILLTINSITTTNFFGINLWVLSMNFIGIGFIGVLWYIDPFNGNRIKSFEKINQKSNNYTDSSPRN